MPRKKIAAAAGQAKTLIVCPVCQSRVATDGSALFEKSPRMDYLENLDSQLLPKLEEKFKELSALLENTQRRLAEQDETVDRLVLELKNEREEKKNVGKKKTRGNAGSAGASEDEW